MDQRKDKISGSGAKADESGHTKKEFEKFLKTQKKG